ncbi:MAG: T9SS type A sorting domain-containing protein [Flavipsychrobacter sp.]
MQHYYHFIRRSIFLLLLVMLGVQTTYAQAPTISTQPSNSTICAGSNTSFGVTASGTGLSYQWQVDQGLGFANVSGSVYSGSTSATLSITGATGTMNNYMYRVIVSNTSGADTSNSADLTVVSAPTILMPPSDVIMCAGGNTTFSVTASSSSTINYQWQVDQGSGYTNLSNTGVYSGVNTNTLTITGATTTMNGYNYRVVATSTGACNPSSTSSSALLTVNALPNITTQPVTSLSLCAGSSSSLSVAATGTSLTYQWQLNTGSGFNNIPGATNNTLALTSVTAGMNGYQYRVIVSGVCAPSVTSNTTTLTVNTLPAIVTQPSATSACAGNTASFSVNATGSGLTYQWQVNPGSGWIDLTNAGPYSNVTTATLDVTANATMDGYLFRCIISGTCPPNDTTVAVALSINSAPSISIQPPATFSGCAGGSTTIGVTATGTGLTYQWQVNTGSGFTNITGAPYSGYNTSSLTITGLSAGMAGYIYRVQITGTCLPNVTSSTATLNVVNTPPSITANPAPVTICAGSNTSFNTTASGSGLTYQWQVNTGSGFTNVTDGGVYSGATTSTLSITGATAAMNGYIYQVVVSGTCAPSVTSTTAMLTVQTPPNITVAPTDQNVCPGSDATFSVTATGTALTYQWQVNTGSGFTNIPSANSVSYTVTGATAGKDGYQYRVVISGTCTPTVTSAAATLHINTLPGITVQPPTTMTACEGSTFSISLTGSGTGVSYQWQENAGSGFSNITNGGVYSGATTASLTITGVTATMNGYVYRAIVSGTCSPAVTSGNTTITVNTAPVVTTQPANDTLCAGGTASFSVAASGTGPLTYQWQIFNGTSWSNIPAIAPFSGTTSATMTIAGVIAAYNGDQFRCVVSGGCTPAATSNTAVLVVNTAPSIISQPSNATVCAGTTATFGVVAAGTALTYQWQVNTGSGFTSITGAVSSTLNVASVTTAMNGYQYRVIVSGTCAPSVTSTVATLNVNTAPVITSNPANTTACVGSTATFSVGATGAGLTYQWQIYNFSIGSFVNMTNTAPYSGVNTATLTISPVSTAVNFTYYRCVVTGTCTPSATSNYAMLSVSTPPSIVTQPPSTIAACTGTNVNISVGATGTGLTYQWQLNTGSGFSNILPGGSYTGINTATLTISGVTPPITGYQYRVIVSGSCTPSVTSNVTTITINSSPSISANPTNKTICEGASTTFAVTASGAGLTYQWQVNTGLGYVNVVNGGVYSGATNATLNITGATLSMDGYLYRVIVSGSCFPAVTSTSASLNINAKPAITNDPRDTAICAGSAAVFSATGTGAGISYQWQVNTGSGYVNVVNGGIYSGATTTTLDISSTTAAMNGYQYRLVVTGTCTPAAISNVGTLRVNTSPTITADPGNMTVCAGGNASFSVAATGSNLTYQWQINTPSGFVNVSNFAPYSGTKSPILLINGAPESFNGNVYRCVVSGSCAPSVVSGSATMTVTNTSQWTGVVSSDWSNPNNWGCGVVPTAVTNVVIPSGVTHMPLIDVPNAICDSLSVSLGASLGFRPGGNALELKGSAFDKGAFDASNGKVILSGNGQQEIPGTTYQELFLTNYGDKMIDGDVVVTDSLNLENGMMVVGDHILYIGDAATIWGGSANSFILTNGLGAIAEQNVGVGGKVGPVFIPVGSLRNSYTPMSIDNSTGTADTFKVWVYDAVYRYYYNNIPTTTKLTSDAVNRTWIVTENTKGGSNVTLTLQWNASDELSGFDRTNCYLSHYLYPDWHSGPAGAANGTGPYSMTLSGITSFSPFGIGSGSSPLPVNTVTMGDSKITVYPNPVSGAELFVKFEQSTEPNAHIRIVDVLGKQLAERNVDLSHQNGIVVVPVEVNSLIPGMYVIQVTDAAGNVMHVERFVKQ